MGYTWDMESRDQISLRLSPTGLAKVTQLGEDTHSTRSAVIRTLLAEALADDAIVRATRRRLEKQL